VATSERSTQPSPGDEYIMSPEAELVSAFERQRMGLADDEPTAGLAFSGGGVRSASFALGVLQAFLARMRPGPRSPDPLDRFHYLSTVSGGGYLGLALLWLRAREPVRDGANEDYRRHFAGKHRGSRTELRGIWLDYFRQHGNYLLPRGLGTLSLIGVALRSLLLSGAVYFGLAVLLMIAAINANILPEAPMLVDGSCRAVDFPLKLALCTDAVSLLAFVGAALAAVCVVFGMGTFVASLVGWLRWLVALTLGLVVSLLAGWTILLSGSGLPLRPGFALLGAAVAAMLVVLLMVWRFLRRITRVTSQATSTQSKRAQLSLIANENWMYRIRIDLQIVLGVLLAIMVGLAVLASLPMIKRLLSEITVASILTALGVIGGYYQAFSGRSKHEGESALGTLRIVLTAAALAYGLLLGAYLVAARLEPVTTWVHLLAGTIALLAIGILLNLNLVGLGRMYRDRLMETFLPDCETIDSNSWGPATGADDGGGLLANLWERTGAHGLYPLANTNVVLVDSMSDLYRNRGGDSFLMSPLYCGSDATGWVRTDKFEGGQLTAATAMATSGAAANPNSGPGGRGVTRNRLVSFLMFFVQARLGVWVSNPKKARSMFVRAGKMLPPNLIHPGIVSGLFGRRLKESTSFVELSDGGHFDNTGLYELIRRRVQLIVLAQAGADPSYSMADLANAVEKVRVDFGVHLRFDKGILLDGVPPTIEGKGPGRGRMYAERGYAIARIDYPPAGKLPAQHGWLLYMQAVPVENVPSDVHAYYRACPTFSNESTADQFFDEVQLEAYRELGYAIAKGALNDINGPNFEAVEARSVD
jgi:hypothetical protein